MPLAQERKPQRTIVVGAGPVGCLAAIYAAGRGDDVELYELRGDLRDPAVIPLNFTKSINLAISERGINALRNAGRPTMLDAILKETIPMYGRMIHGEKHGRLYEQHQAYDIDGKFIRAVDRGRLNKCLLDELEAMPNVKIFFNHKLAGADFKRNIAWFEHRHQSAPANARYPSRPTGKPGVTEIEVPFDFMIGADGAHSAARYHLMKFARMTYQQEYIETMWCEFHIPARNGGGNGGGDEDEGAEFALSPNHLHIWPGGQDDMFIAIPNTDRSFTATLFLPGARFEQLDRAHDAVLPSTFRTHFPGVVPDLISEEEIVRQFRSNRHLPLISIKCHPYHYGGSVVILGDAAHAMVPFYGQGMNAGMEDVLQLYRWLDRLLPPAPPTSDPPPRRPDPSEDPREAGPHDLLASLTDPSPAQRAERRAWALSMYTAERHPDAVAICDLALANYEEMSSHVTSPAYLLRKWAEERLHAHLPRWLGWGATQYARVSFGTERYSVVRDEARRQQGRLRAAALAVAVGIAGTAAIGLAKACRRWGVL